MLNPGVLGGGGGGCEYGHNNNNANPDLASLFLAVRVF